jgi:hypothetical protein
VRRRGVSPIRKNQRSETAFVGDAGTSVIPFDDAAVTIDVLKTVTRYNGRTDWV